MNIADKFVDRRKGSIKIGTLLMHGTIFCKVCLEGPVNLDFLLQ